MTTTASGKYAIVHNHDYLGKRTFDITRDGHPVACGFPTVTDADIWIEKYGPKVEQDKALFEDPKAIDTPEITLLRQFLAQLPYRHPDRPGIMRAIDVLEGYTKGSLMSAIPPIGKDAK
jgi:hypothetical protein